MNNKRQELQAALEGATTEQLVGILALGCAITGTEPGNIGKHSNGVFKRAIKKIREIQSSLPDRVEDVEKAVAIIREEWLHKGGHTK